MNETQEQEVIEYRHFDADDIVRIRSNPVVVTRIDGKGKEVEVNAGLMMKVGICLGIRKAPWFSDEIRTGPNGFDNGVNETVFDKRMNQEFRRIPINRIDQLFAEVEKFNKVAFDAGNFAKK